MSVTVACEAGVEQFLTSTSEPHPTHPAERRRTQKHLEVRLKCSRTDAADLSKQFELDRLRLAGVNYLGRRASTVLTGSGVVIDV